MALLSCSAASSPPSPPPNSEASGHTVQSHGFEQVQVIFVIDGDTIEVELASKKRERIRYIGLDAPEVEHPQKPGECYGVQGAALNSTLVGKKKVELERDRTDRDRYGRLLRYVWVEGRLVNEELVALGAAKARAYPPDLRYQTRLFEAQSKARDSRQGLWEACG